MLDGQQVSETDPEACLPSVHLDLQSIPMHVYMYMTYYICYSYTQFGYTLVVLEFLYMYLLSYSLGHDVCVVWPEGVHPCFWPRDCGNASGTTWL